jgi:hypothetical protein
VPINTINTLIKQSADKILFVPLGGNNPGPSGYQNVAGVALVVAAATAESARAPFTSTSDDSVWACVEELCGRIEGLAIPTAIFLG